MPLFNSLPAAYMLLNLQQNYALLRAQEGGARMPNIKSISSLRNYSSVLNEVETGSPVFLTRDGKGKYAILDMEEYDSMREALWGRLYDELDEARLSRSVSLEEAKIMVVSNG